VLDRQRQIAAQCEHVGKEGILGVLDGVAVIDDRDRQRLHPSHRPDFGITPDRDIDRDHAVACRIIKLDRLVPHRPFAEREIGCGDKGDDGNSDDQATFHSVLGGQSLFKR